MVFNALIFVLDPKEEIIQQVFLTYFLNQTNYYLIAIVNSFKKFVVINNY